jgi:hypothetical protein
MAVWRFEDHGDFIAFRECRVDVERTARQSPMERIARLRIRKDFALASRERTDFRITP